MLRGRTVGQQRLLRIIAAVALAAFVTACTTTRAVDVQAPTAFAEEVRPGDWVAITTHDGRELLFEVVRVEPDALVGARERVERDEVAGLEVRRVDVLRSLGLTAGGGAAFFLILGLIFVAIAPAVILSGATP